MYPIWPWVEHRATFPRGLLRALPWRRCTVGSSDRIRMIDLQPLLPLPRAPATRTRNPDLGAPCCVGCPAVSSKKPGVAPTPSGLPASQPGSQKWATASNCTQHHQPSSARHGTARHGDKGAFSGPAVAIEPVCACRILSLSLLVLILILSASTLICPRGAEPCTHAPNTGIARVTS